MRNSLRLALLALVGLAAPAPAAEEPAPNTLTEKERGNGWRLLFDGKTTKGWHAYRGKDVPDKWKVIDGALVVSPKNGKHGGDICTDDNFGDFELAFEWKVTPGANSGVMYHVGEGEDAPYFTGPEYQILDNKRHPDGRSKLTSAASCYALYPPSEDVTRPVGEWNQSRIVVHGGKVEHWLNGKKVVAYEIGSADWNERVARSKFKAWKKFGTLKKGRIDLQDHGDEVSFRSLKIKTPKE
jgi:3-keto-disaccharide hydrolase